MVAQGVSTSGEPLLQESPLYVKYSAVRSTCFPDEQTKHQRCWDLPRGP